MRFFAFSLLRDDVRDATEERPVRLFSSVANIPRRLTTESLLEIFFLVGERIFFGGDGDTAFSVTLVGVRLVRNRGRSVRGGDTDAGTIVRLGLAAFTVLPASARRVFTRTNALPEPIRFDFGVAGLKSFGFFCFWCIRSGAGSLLGDDATSGRVFVGTGTGTTLRCGDLGWIACCVARGSSVRDLSRRFRTLDPVGAALLGFHVLMGRSDLCCWFR